MGFLSFHHIKVLGDLGLGGLIGWEVSQWEEIPTLVQQFGSHLNQAFSLDSNPFYSFSIFGELHQAWTRRTKHVHLFDLWWKNLEKCNSEFKKVSSQCSEVKIHSYGDKWVYGFLVTCWWKWKNSKTNMVNAPLNFFMHWWDLGVILKWNWFEHVMVNLCSKSHLKVSNQSYGKML